MHVDTKTKAHACNTLFTCMEYGGNPSLTHVHIHVHSAKIIFVLQNNYSQLAKIMYTSTESYGLIEARVSLIMGTRYIPLSG